MLNSDRSDGSLVTRSVDLDVTRHQVFERLLFDLSTQFVVVKLNAEELSAAIGDALQRVNAWLFVAGTAIGRVEGEKAPTVLFTASLDESELPLATLTAGSFESVLAGDDMFVTRQSSTAMGQALAALDLDAVLVLPLSDEEQVITYLACWWRGERELTPAQRAQLRMLGELTLAALHRHEAEARQAELEEKLRQGRKLQSLGLLAGGVAHDFNNILTVMRGCAEAALTENPAASVAECLSEIIDAVDQASAMTRKLLTFGRHSVSSRMPVAVTDVVRSIQRLLARLLRENITLHFDMATEPCVVSASAIDIEQIIMNLCINSGEAMPDGGDLKVRTRRVERTSVSDPRPRSYVEIGVTDAGLGMTAEQAARIFEPFYTTKAFGEGAGLGLSVVHGIVTQVGGFVEVDTRPGTGTEMRIYLPSVDAEPHSGPSSTIRVAARSDRTILVADDLPSLCLIISRALKAAGYKTVCASNGQRALELYAQHSDDVCLVVLDVIMPVMGGRQTYDELSLLKRDLPVLFVSGYTADALPPGYIDHPLRELLLKPFTGDQLLEAVNRLLERADSMPKSDRSVLL
jgi:signal transduction histidine kinase/ActR/RegA family two-component response regulator